MRRKQAVGRQQKPASCPAAARPSESTSASAHKNMPADGCVNSFRPVFSSIRAVCRARRRAGYAGVQVPPVVSFRQNLVDDALVQFRTRHADEHLLVGGAPSPHQRMPRRSPSADSSRARLRKAAEKDHALELIERCKPRCREVRRAQIAVHIVFHDDEVVLLRQLQNAIRLRRRQRRAGRRFCKTELMMSIFGFHVTTTTNVSSASRSGPSGV